MSHCLSDRAAAHIPCDGVRPVPGLFVLGLHFQRRRNSAFIDGVGDDAAFLADLIAGRHCHWREPRIARERRRHGPCD